MSRPTIAPVLRAKLPVADTTCSQAMSPLSVRTIHRRRRALDAVDGGVAVDLGAARARALGEGLGEVGRLHVAVVGMLDRADDAVGVAERPQLLHLLGGDQVDVDADRLGGAGIIHVLVPAVLGAGEAEVGDLTKPTSWPVSSSSVL